MDANYSIYIEDYVLSYLRREVDSLELSEIFFYGKRENGGRKFLIYGAGRKREIAAFANYVLLDEIVCRLTQAGPVFMVREGNGDYKVNGFQTFYADNEAMQNYLIEWTSRKEEGGEGEKANWKRSGLQEGREASVVRESFEPEGKRRSVSAISGQLCLILVVLAAIVISSVNSYEKMERVNQSAREVFFAIENQEAGQETGQRDASEDALSEEIEKQEKRTEILVERDTGADHISVEDAVRAENANQKEEANQTEENETAASDTSAQTDESQTQEKKENMSEETDASKEDFPEEALSRNITRYYEVERGDTLYTISQKIYGNASKVEKICEMNGILDPDKINEGQKIILP